MSADVQAAVIGAGIAGLAAACELRRSGVEVLLLEAQVRAGGVMQTEERRGFCFERGPNSLRIHAAALDFLRRHGLEPALLAAGPEAQLRQLFCDGRLEPVPTRLTGALRTPLLSARGKLRALREPFVARGSGENESVAEFVARRFGPEVVERLIGPFLVGVYAGDERQLGAEAVFPSLVAFERAHGSVLRGALARAFARRGAAGLRGSWSAQGGLGGLAGRLAAALGPALRLESPVTALLREGSRWRLDLGGRGGALRAEALVVASEAGSAARLLERAAPEAAQILAGIEYAPLVTLALDVDPRDARAPIRGFGFLVPREAELELLGALFMSRVFPGRAPPGRELVMAMIGGRRWPGAVEEPEDRLLARVARGLERTLGLRTAPVPLAVARWLRAVPQPGPDHVARVRRVRERVAELPGLALAGAYLDGVAVPDALASGVRAAAELAPAVRAAAAGGAGGTGRPR